MGGPFYLIEPSLWIYVKNLYYNKKYQESFCILNSYSLYYLVLQNTKRDYSSQKETTVHKKRLQFTKRDRVKLLCIYQKALNQTFHTRFLTTK